MKKVIIALAIMLAISTMAFAKTYEVSVDNKIAEYAEQRHPDMKTYLETQVRNVARHQASYLRSVAVNKYDKDQLTDKEFADEMKELKKVK